MIQIKANNSKGYYEFENGGVVDLLYPSSNTRRGRVQDNGLTCGALTAENFGVYRLEYESMSEYRIRKLTPRECGRLMGVSDENITKMLEVNSNSQCYKQYGNSIVVDVLAAMFSQLGIKGVNKWNERLDGKY